VYIIFITHIHIFCYLKTFKKKDKEYMYGNFLHFVYLTVSLHFK